jgi:alcohol dehydrogenase (cytochrome c)
LNLLYRTALSCAVAIFATLFAPALADQKGTTSNWLGYQGDYTGMRYSALDQINGSNAARLKRVCSFVLDDDESFQAGPTVNDGTLFVTTFKDTYAVDAATCGLRWKDHVESPTPPFGAIRGTAYDNGRLFRGVYTGSLLALDSGTGKHLWQTTVVEPNSSEYIVAAPVVWNGLVFIGTAGADMGARCEIVALDAASGRIVWRFQLAPTGDTRNADTWPSGVHVAGGSNWTSLALDTANGLLYVPAGNPGPDFDAADRPGKNLYTGSVVVLDAKSGSLKTWYQLDPNDYHDWDVSAPPSLFSAADGSALLTESSKDGYLYGIEIGTGNIRYKTAVTTIANVDAPLTQAGTRFCPGTQGGSEWNGTAYSPLTNLVYVNTIDMCSTVKLEAGKATFTPGQPFIASANGFGDSDKDPRGWLNAVDASSGKTVWSYHASTPMVAAVTATRGNLVFTGDLKGNFYAFDARNGRIVYQSAVGKAIGGGIASYTVAGKQYVGVVAGTPSKMWNLPPTKGEVAIYAL